MASATEYFQHVGTSLREGEERKLPSVQQAHYPISDTGLAACLGVLGIPFRTPEPFTDDVGLDYRGNETGRRCVFWLSDASPAINGDPKTAHRTEQITTAWNDRARFEQKHPLHPLTYMRAGLDARTYWVRICAGDSRIARLPVEAPSDSFATDSINGASLLYACGYQPRAYNGRAFFLAPTFNGVHAQQLLASAALAEGATRQQWIAKVLHAYNHLLQITKGRTVILRQDFGDGQTLLLTADSSAKVRDRFYSLL